MEQVLNGYGPDIITYFKGILVPRKVAVLARLQNNDGPILVEQLKGAESENRPQVAMLAVAKRFEDTITLRDIEEALARCEDGTYGVCKDCGQQILLKRLEAIPTASRCVSCQEKHSKSRRPPQVSKNNHFTSAAPVTVTGSIQGQRVA